MKRSDEVVWQTLLYLYRILPAKPNHEDPLARLSNDMKSRVSRCSTVGRFEIHMNAKGFNCIMKQRTRENFLKEISGVIARTC